MGIPYIDVIERMKDAGRLKNDSAVARDLGITPQALSNYKKRGQMPADHVVHFAGLHGLSMDWLVTGQGADTVPPSLPAFGPFSPDELIYIGKLLKALRGGNGSARVVRFTLDSMAEVTP